MKEYWIVSSNSNKFRLDDLLRNNNVVDWKQGQYKFKTGDIVYIYSTLPKGRITYEMEVVKDNIPFDEVINQEEYWLDRKEFQKGYSRKYKSVQFSRQDDYRRIVHCT